MLFVVGNLVISILGERLVRLRIHQAVNLRRISNLNLRQPAVRFGALVDGTGLVLEHAVRFHNLAADGCHDVRSALDGLDGADGLAGVDFEVEGGQLDVDNVAEGFCCVGGDADCACGKEVVRGLRRGA
jgi:hypothetical protein